MPKPRGKHVEVAGFVAAELNVAIRQRQLPYFVPKECIVRSPDGAFGYEPNVIGVDRAALADAPRWEQGSILTLGKPIKLIVEVVSTLLSSRVLPDWLQYFSSYPNGKHPNGKPAQKGFKSLTTQG